MIPWDYSPSSGAKLRFFLGMFTNFVRRNSTPTYIPPILHTSADFFGKKAANTSRKIILVGG